METSSTVCIIFSLLCMSSCLASLALHSFMEALCNASVVVFAPNVEWRLFSFPLHSVSRFHCYRCFSFHCQCRTGIEQVALLLDFKSDDPLNNPLDFNGLTVTELQLCPKKNGGPLVSLSLSLSLSVSLSFPAWWTSLPVGSAGGAKFYRNESHFMRFISEKFCPTCCSPASWRSRWGKTLHKFIL